MRKVIETLGARKTGYGHWSISIEVNGIVLKTTITNSLAIDAICDECFDDAHDDSEYYESRREAQEALVNEILAANEMDGLSS